MKQDIDNINQLFDLDFDYNSQFRYFPLDENEEFLSLSTMPSRHKTYWNKYFKVKIYTLEYGHKLNEFMECFKENGNYYLQNYWIEYAVLDDQAYFAFRMVDGKDLLFSLIDDYSKERAQDLISRTYEVLEDNMCVKLPDGKYLVAHDYKLFNVIDVDGRIICFDYDRFSVVDDKTILHKEYWHKVAKDDIGAESLGIPLDEQKRVMEIFNEAESENTI